MLAIKRDGARTFNEFFANQMPAKPMRENQSVRGYLLPIGSVAGLSRLPFPVEQYSNSNRYVHEQINSIRVQEKFRQIKAYVIASGWANTDMVAFTGRLSRALGSVFADEPHTIAINTWDAVLYPKNHPYRMTFSNTITSPRAVSMACLSQRVLSPAVIR